MQKLFLVIISLLLFAGCQSSKVLFEDGKTDWKIIISPDADETEKYAAEELSNFLRKISSSNFEIVSSSNTPDENTIVLGTPKSNKIINKLAETLQLTEGGEQKTAIYFLDGNLYLAGISSKAVLHSVYWFLQNELGCRWFWPETEADGEFIPIRETFSLSRLAVNYEPKIRYRGYHFLNGTNYKLEQWLARNFGNIIRHGTAGGPERMKERATLGYYHYYSGHNVDPNWGIAKLDDVEKAMKEKPEWFAEVNGKPHKDHYCWNNQEVEDLLVENVIKMIPTLPGLEILGFYPSDTQNYCTCSICRKNDISTNWFALVKRLSTRISKVYPDLRFASIAYQGYLPFPKCDVSGYEFIEYALYQRCYVHPFCSDCSTNKYAMKAWEPWLNSGIPTGIYGYEYDIFRPDMMVPFYSMLSDQMRFFEEKNVVAVLPEVSGTYGSTRKDMRLAFYIYTQLLWNPQADVQELLKDFCKYVYPSASEIMYKYHAMMDKAWEKQEAHIAVYHNPPIVAADFINAQMIDNVLEMFAEAELKMKNNSATKAESNALEFERKHFARWIQVYLQNAEKISLLPGKETVAFAQDLKASWSKDGLKIYSSKPIKVDYYDSEANIQSQNGTELFFKDKELKNAVVRQVLLNNKDLQVFYCSDKAELQGKALYFLDDPKAKWNNISKLRSAFLENGWQLEFAPEKDFKSYDIVALKIDSKSNSQNFPRKELFDYVENGGIAIISAVGQFDFVDILGSKEFDLTWTGNQDYNWKLRYTQYLKPGDWLSKPDDLEKSLTRLCTPTSGYELPVGSQWETLATMRKKDASTAPYILKMKKGKGAIYLTSGTLGLGNDGAWMTFGSSHPESVTALFNNLKQNK